MNIPEHLLFRRRKKLPAIVAAEAAECGLACLAMLAAYHGHNVDLNGMRQRFSVSLAGTGLRDIMFFADQLDFGTRAVRAEIGALKHLKLPAILHWDMNHFVVLESINARHAFIHDPARGRIRLSLQVLSQHFTGIALELWPSNRFTPVEARIPIKISSLWSGMSGLYSSAGIVITLSIALQIVTFALPFQLQLIVDEALTQSDSNLLIVIALAFVALIALQAITTAMRDWSIQLLGGQFVFQIVGNVVRHLIRLPARYFENRHVGDIISRIQSTKAIQEAITQGTISAVIDGGMAVLAGAILFLYAPTLAFAVLVSVLLLIAINLLFFPVIRHRTREMIMASAAEQSHVMESVRAITTIKLLGRESERESAWRNLYSKSFNAAISLGRMQISLTLIQNLVVGGQMILITYLGAKNVMEARGLSVGMLVAFLAFRQTFTDRALSLISKAFQLRMLGLHIDRLGDIVAQEAETGRSDFPQNTVNGGISMRDVAFRYSDAGAWILRDVNLTIEPGDFVAIVGPSGGGKTTLLKVMLGLHRPESGHVMLDGSTTNDAIWRGWRSQVGVVAQDDKLLAGTLADNIAFFDPDIDMGLVHEAAKCAQIHADIIKMPMGYLTLVGDMGSTLSGGQRQRILLARALYRQPKVLVLDEGTANLDPETEETIANLVEGMPITRIVVAHRPALIQKAKRVFRAENGSIRELRTE
jgi:ATP-binding cassette subfamily B protein RaxB